MASTDIADGNVRGLLAFMDFMIEKGYGSAAAIDPWKSAAKQVFERVEGEGFEEADVRSVDIDEYIGRFENRSHGKYSANSLRAYRGRFRRAVESYRSYLADPNWRPSFQASSRSSQINGIVEKQTRRRSRATTPKPEQPQVSSASSTLIAYPFPLQSGQIAQLHLPTQLEHGDAERLIQFVRALVFDQPRQLRAGGPDTEE
jgi:hypothetical protein